MKINCPHCNFTAFTLALPQNLMVCKVIRTQGFLYKKDLPLPIFTCLGGCPP